MKNLLLILLFLYFLFSIFTAPVDNAFAVVQMDGLGHYRVLNNYPVVKDKCVSFIDGQGEHLKFCGSFRIIDKRDFHVIDQLARAN